MFKVHACDTPVIFQGNNLKFQINTIVSNFLFHRFEVGKIQSHVFVCGFV